MKPIDMSRIVDRRRYDTRTATLLAGDGYWDGHNFERRGRNTWLYRTPGGRYFTVTRTQWQGEQDALEPVDLDTAIDPRVHGGAAVGARSELRRGVSRRDCRNSVM